MDIVEGHPSYDRGQGPIMHFYSGKRLKQWHSFTWLSGVIFLLSIPGLISGLAAPPSAAPITMGAIFLVLFFQKKENSLNLASMTGPFILLLYFIFFSLTIFTIIPEHRIYYDIFINNAFFSLFITISCFLIVLLGLHDQDRNWHIEWMRIALAVIVFTNIFLIFLGIEHVGSADFAQSSQANSTLAFFGIAQVRIVPPISGGAQMAALIPAVLLSACLLELPRASAVLMAAAALLLLILIDSRGALLAPLLALFAWRFRRSASPNIMSAIILLIPVIYPLILTFAGDISNNFGGRNYQAILSNRNVIWQVGFQHIDNMTFISFLFGDGAFSTYTTGVNYRFGDLFASHSTTARDFAGMHNTYLQLFLDLGLVGLLAFIVITYFVVRNVLMRSLDGRAGLQIHFCMIVSVLFMSATEVLIPPYAKEAAVLLLILWMGGVISEASHRREGNI